MHHLGELLALLTVAPLGIFFGAMLTEGLNEAGALHVMNAMIVRLCGL